MLCYTLHQTGIILCTADLNPQAVELTPESSICFWRPACCCHAFTVIAGSFLIANACSCKLGLKVGTERCSIKCQPVPTRAAGDQHGNIRVWDLTANACSCELVPEVGTAVRSITVALDGSLVVAANNAGTCYVWRMMRGASMTTHFEPLHKLRAHAGQHD